MSSSSPNTPATDLRVSAYDRAAGLLVSLLVIVGCFVLVLVLLWLANRAIHDNYVPPVELIEEPGGRADHALGMARELEEPGVEELADVERPQLADSLAAVTTTVTAQPATLDEMLGDNDQVGRGSGQGDSHAAGPGGEGDPEVIPRWQRWDIDFTTSSVNAYARQLDFFGIELAAFAGGPQVHYAKNLAAAKPQVRVVDGGGDERLCFFDPTGRTPEFDGQLLAKAGVDTTGRIVATFYPAALENKLALLEQEAADGRELKDIRRTVFVVQSVGGGYEFVVDRQEYR